ncbi:MAG: hypothetical protein KGJ59_04150 [Bacteroidota bacterium]|nr:hypothetical protein [Bacteroidota bacterium]
MPAIVALFDVPGMSSGQYDNTIKELESIGEGDPRGRLHHVAFSKKSGWFVVDVWESEELLNRFAQKLIPILQKNGVTPPSVETYPVHKIIKGESTEVL